MMLHFISQQNAIQPLRATTTTKTATNLTGLIDRNGNYYKISQIEAKKKNKLTTARMLWRDKNRQKSQLVTNAVNQQYLL